MSDMEVVQKQTGCMSGIMHIFDHGYLLGQRHHDRHSHHPKSLPPGQSDEQNSLSIELQTNSVSVSSSSTAMSSSDCSKSVIFEPCWSPFLHGRQPDSFMQSVDIRDVIKSSMTREPRVVSIKTVAKDERVGPAMKRVDSPRPFPHQNPVQSRFSCDGWEDQRASRVKSSVKIKELPRLSLDSRQGYISNSTNDPTSNKKPSSSVVARLMGLEALSLTSSVDESKDLKHEARRVHKPQRAVKRGHVITRIPLETAPWKLESVDRARLMSRCTSKERPPRAEPGSRSVYDEIEKRLTGHDYKTAGKDLRVLKQILEAMQKTRDRLENKQHMLDDGGIDDILSQKVDQPVSPTVSQKKVKHAEVRRDSVAKKRLKDPNVREMKMNSKPLSTSNVPDCSRTVRSKMQRSKSSVNGPSSDSTRAKKQPGMQRASLGSPNRNRKAKSIDSLQDSSETRNLSQQSETVSFQSENDSEVTSTEWAQKVDSPLRPKENHKSNITGWLTEEKSTVDHAKHTMEQPSPVSVLDAYYTEEEPSPVKKKTTAFNDEEILQSKEEQDQAGVNKLPNSTDDAKSNHSVTSPCEGETGDHEYVEEIILASGCLRDLDRATTIVQLHPTASFIRPELFHVLEKTKTCREFTDDRYNNKVKRSKIRRKLVFDTVNDVLGHKLAMLGTLKPHKGRILNADKLLEEVWSGIDNLQNKSEICLSDEDDEVINIINADVNKRSQDWEEYRHQLPGLVLDIERLIFKDLINEVVNS